MGRERANTGFGPSYLTLTCPTSSKATNLASTWFKYGPFRSTNLSYAAAYSLPPSSSGGASTSKGYVRMQGRISSASSQGQVSFTLHSSTKAMVYASTARAGIFGFLRALTTGLPTTGGSSSGTATTGAGTLTLYFAAVP